MTHKQKICIAPYQLNNFYGTFPTKKTPNPTGFTGEFYQIFQKERITILHKLFLNIGEENLSPTHFMSQHNLTSKPGKDIIKNIKTKTKEFRLRRLMNKHTKILYKN